MKTALWKRKRKMIFDIIATVIFYGTLIFYFIMFLFGLFAKKHEGVKALILVAFFVSLFIWSMTRLFY